MMTKASQKGNSKKLIFMILAGLILLGTGVGGSLYFTGMLGGGGSTTEEEEPEETKEAKKIPIYFAFTDPFVVNFETEQGLRFLQVSMELMSYQQEAIDAIQIHLPVIKNNIILILSDQSYGTLVTLEGKEEIRKMAMNEIQAILKKYEVEATIEEVYFTNFVMQ